MNERQLLKSLVASVASAGILVDPVLVTHFYITLKSRPLIILSGPPGTGKSALVQCLARVLVNEDLRQFQSMIGHAWWAGQAGNVALLTEAQSRLNTGKFMLLVDEAGRAGNSDQLYIACMNNISPAEVSGFFTETAFQIQNERLMRLPSYHFVQPVLYPRNLVVIGTMDSQWQSGIDDNFRRAGSVIMWQAEPAQVRTAVPELLHDFTQAQAAFLESRIANGQAANAKLASLPVDVSPTVESLSQIKDALTEYGFQLPSSFVDSGMIYLANAWSNDGQGLFADKHEENLEIALDSLIAEEALRPNLCQVAGSDRLTGRLLNMLGEGYPRVCSALGKPA